ncbi:MAG TPA: cupredoxin domain-containing protein [Trueperaceae bacterium]|nr:cupredoxin domain-containing protein [Trueperaceae bacterium]
MSKFAKLLLAAVVAFGFGAAFAQDQEPTVEFTLHGGIGTAGFQFTGVGGDIDGVVNPDLNVKVGDVVKVTIISDGMEHDFVIDDLGVKSESVMGAELSVSVVFTVTEAGTFTYYCSTPGHALPDLGIGMFGNFIVAAAD